MQEYTTFILCCVLFFLYPKSSIKFHFTSDSLSNTNNTLLLVFTTLYLFLSSIFRFCDTKPKESILYFTQIEQKRKNKRADWYVKK